MKERPILFSGSMVRALLAGTKTQTRRVVKLPRSLAAGDLERAWPDKLWGVTPGLHVPMPDESSQRLRNPWGWPEQSKLWVRETWAQNRNQTSDTKEDRSVVYRADGGERAMDNGIELRWRPSIHMPRWASRITLWITDVRVERLQEISAVDARAEGIQIPAPTITPAEFDHDCVVAYRNLWESINGPGSWDENPFVWVIEFKRAAQSRSEKQP